MLIEDFIGQHRIILELSTQIANAIHERKPILHTVFYGPPGLGKTTLAELIAFEICRSPVKKIGQEFTLKELYRLLRSVYFMDIVFIDEIHSTKPEVLEILYGPLQEITNVHKKFNKDKSKSFPETYNWEGKQYNCFTLIGATTSVGMISKPLRDRFVNKFEFSLYSIDELCIILKELGCNDECAKFIAQRSRGIPRNAINFYLKLNTTKNLTISHCEQMFDLMSIDKLGLTETDIKLLHYLANNGVTGEQALYLALNIDKEDLIHIYEPYLMQLGFIKRTPKGRSITFKGEDYIKTHDC